MSSTTSVDKSPKGKRKIRSVKKKSATRLSNEEEEVFDGGDVKKPFLSHASKSKGSITAALWSSNKGDTALSEIIVPYTPLRQDRFYDWPPETSQSKCKNLANSIRPVYCDDAGGATDMSSRTKPKAS